MSDASARLKVVALIPLYLNMSDDPQQRLQVDAATELLLNVQHFLERRMVIHQNAGAEATLQNVSSIIGRHAVLGCHRQPSRLLMKHPSSQSSLASRHFAVQLRCGQATMGRLLLPLRPYHIQRALCSSRRGSPCHTV